MCPVWCVLLSIAGLTLATQVICSQCPLVHSTLSCTMKPPRPTQDLWVSQKQLSQYPLKTFSAPLILRLHFPSRISHSGHGDELWSSFTNERRVCSLNNLRYGHLPKCLVFQHFSVCFCCYFNWKIMYITLRCYMLLSLYEPFNFFIHSQKFSNFNPFILYWYAIEFIQRLRC